MPTAPKTNKPKKVFKVDIQRASASSRGYDRNWRNARIAYLRKNPLCEKCKAEGVTKQALDIDHITPLSEGGKRLSFDNMMALCRRCHNAKTHGHSYNPRMKED